MIRRQWSHASGSIHFPETLRFIRAIAISVRSSQQVAAAAPRMMRSFAMRRHWTMPASVGAAVGLRTRPTTAALLVNK